MRIRSDASHVMEFTREVGTECAITDADCRQLATFLVSLQKDGVQEYLQAMFANILLRLSDRLGRLYSELRVVLDEWPDYTIEEKKRIARAAIARVTVDDDRIDVVFRAAGA